MAVSTDEKRQVALAWNSLLTRVTGSPSTAELESAAKYGGPEVDAVIEELVRIQGKQGKDGSRVDSSLFDWLSGKISDDEFGQDLFEFRSRLDDFQKVLKLTSGDQKYKAAFKIGLDYFDDEIAPIMIDYMQPRKPKVPWAALIIGLGALAIVGWKLGRE